MVNQINEEERPSRITETKKNKERPNVFFYHLNAFLCFSVLINFKENWEKKRVVEKEMHRPSHAGIEIPTCCYTFSHISLSVFSPPFRAI